MKKLDLAIGRSIYKINCKDGQEADLKDLANKLNLLVNKLSLAIRDADDATLLVIAAMTLQEELDKSDDKKQDLEKKYSEDDLYDAITDNMENISDYIEKLTSKIQNY